MAIFFKFITFVIVQFYKSFYMITLEKTTYSIHDVYVLMQETTNYFLCIHHYEFKNLSILNSIIYGQLYIDNKIIIFSVDSTNIINSCTDCTNLIIIDKYIFTIL